MAVSVNVRWHRLKHGELWARRNASEERMWRAIDQLNRERSLDSRPAVRKPDGTTTFHQTWGDVFGDFTSVLDKQVDQAKVDELRTAIENVGALIKEHGFQHPQWEGICWAKKIEPFLQSDTERRLVSRMKRRDDLTGDYWIWPGAFTNVSGWEFADLFAPPVSVKVKTPSNPRSRVPSDKPKKDNHWRLFFACKE